MGTGERAPISIFARHLGIWPETIWPWPLCDTMCAPLFFVDGDDDDGGGGVEEESHSWEARRWWKCQLPWQQKCFAMEEVPVSSLLWPPGKRWTGRSTGQTSTDTNLMLDLLITILWPKNPQVKWNVTHDGSHISAWWVFPSGMSATQKSQGLVHKILQASSSHCFFCIWEQNEEIERPWHSGWK